MLTACFGRIRESELQMIDWSIWLCNQVCLLKCKGIDWLSDGTNQNLVALEHTEFECRDIIHIKKKLSLEFLECSFSGVTIKIFGFSTEFYFTYVNFLILIFFEKISPYFMEKKTGLNFDVSQKDEISEHFQSISLLN